MFVWYDECEQEILLIFKKGVLIYETKTIDPSDSTGAFALRGCFERGNAAHFCQ
jgi:hypothetical protein